MFYIEFKSKCYFFILDCIQKWLKNRSACPLCNKEWDYSKLEKILPDGAIALWFYKFIGIYSIANICIYIFLVVLNLATKKAYLLQKKKNYFRRFKANDIYAKICVKKFFSINQLRFIKCKAFYFKRPIELKIIVHVDSLLW